MAIIRAAKNWSANPSAETNLTGIIGSGAGTVNARVSDKAWDGAWSVKTTTAAVNFSGVVWTATLTGLALTGVSHSVAGKIRVWATNGYVIPFVRLRVQYTDATIVDSPATLDWFTGNGEWKEAEFPAIETDPTKTISIIRIYLTTWTTPVAGIEWYTDGCDFRIDEESVDTYVAGDQGALYGWTGTAHNSPSYRLEDVALGPTGYGGAIVVESGVYRSDALGNLYEDLTPYVYGGSADFDIDREIKGTLKLQVTDPKKFGLFDWVSVFQRIKIAGSPDVTYPVGLFQLGEPRATWIDGLAEIPGSDITSILAGASFPDTVNFAAGTLYTTVMQSLCSLVGLGSRTSFAESNRVIPTGGITFQAAENVLKALNKLMADHGRYSAHPSSDGRIVGLPFRDRLIVTPDARYWLGQDSTMVGDIVEEQNADNIYNYVVAVKTSNTGAPLSATAENNDPTHPFSTIALGTKAGTGKLYKVKELNLNDAATVTVLEEAARDYLQKSSMIRTLSLMTYPRPFALHEVVDVDLTASNAEHLSGRYLVNAHSIGLVGSAGTMTLKLKRVETTNG